MKVVPNMSQCSCAHSQESNTSSMNEEEAYVITTTQKAQVSILGASSTRYKGTPPQEQAKVGDYLNPVAEHARLVAIQNWSNEDWRKYKEKRSNQDVGLQSKGGTGLGVKDQDLSPTIDDMPLEPNDIRLVDNMLEASIQLLFRTLIQCMP